MPRITVNNYKTCAVVEIVTPSLLDTAELDSLGADLFNLVDVEDRRRIAVDFGRVEFISSRAIGVLIQLHKKTAALRGGLLVVCNLSPRLLELLKITRLDKVLTIKPSQTEAMKHFERMSALV